MQYLALVQMMYEYKMDEEEADREDVHGMISSNNELLLRGSPTNESLRFIFCFSLIVGPFHLSDGMEWGWDIWLNRRDGKESEIQSTNETSSDFDPCSCATKE